MRISITPCVWIDFNLCLLTYLYSFFFSPLFSHWIWTEQFELWIGIEFIFYNKIEQSLRCGNDIRFGKISLLPLDLNFVLISFSNFVLITNISRHRSHCLSAAHQFSASFVWCQRMHVDYWRHFFAHAYCGCSIATTQMASHHRHNVRITAQRTIALPGHFAQRVNVSIDWKIFRIKL